VNILSSYLANILTCGPGNTISSALANICTSDLAIILTNCAPISTLTSGPANSLKIGPYGIYHRSATTNILTSASAESTSNQAAIPPSGPSIFLTSGRSGPG
jgi:hypothetical protein